MNSDPAKCLEGFPKRLGMEVGLAMCKGGGQGGGEGPAQCASGK